ncbi:MAG: DUF4349 domain-containing protein [Clostridia bacterium]|nr:DUF4349 domain-containing protein [Clostridia bacterium]
MNKEKYLKEIDSVTPSQELKEKIQDLPHNSKNKHIWIPVAVLAACLAFVIIVIPSAGNIKYGYNGDKYASEGIENYNQKEKLYADEAAGSSSTTVTSDERKITKNASLNIEVKDLDKFINIIKEELNNKKGYIDSEDKSVYDNSSSCTLVVKIPSENLDSFINLIDINSTVKSQQIDSSDITSAYTDNEAKIKSLETEQETLLKIMEKAENLTDVIQLQDKLAEIRSELDSCKSMKKIMDNQVEYSSVTINVNESERTIKTDGSFFSQVKEKFSNSLYSIGDFFRSLALIVLGGIPYIVIISIVAVIVVIIIKKRRK